MERWPYRPTGEASMGNHDLAPEGWPLGEGGTVEEVIELRVTQVGERVDRLVASAVDRLSRAQVQRLIADGLITVNGRPVKSSYRVQDNDRVVVRVPPSPSAIPEPQSIPLDIVYEDEDVIVVNKPAGMVVHPAYGHLDGTLVNALLAHYPNLVESEDRLRPGIVHRLDKDTSGLIIVAKNDEARKHLQRQFKARVVRKVYLALLEGQIEPSAGRIEAPIGRDPRQRQRMAVLPQGGRPAETEYRVLEYLRDHTLVEAIPRTGRTHQVRVHFAWLGHPVAGDSVYGRRKRPPTLRRQFLHAQALGFKLPANDEYVEFEAKLPEDLREVLRQLRGQLGYPKCATEA